MSKYLFDKDSSVIVLDVFIGNKGIRKKIRMALDTGATYVMIPWEVAEILELKPELSKERIETVTASGVEKVPLVNLEIVRVLDKEARTIRAIVHDLPSRSYVDGLLGLSFLKNFNLHINFKEGTLEIE
ncbi:MAG: retroviral-like aspartic protease family protein [Candidatus Aenigmarchaeota archaeon]|nr:retroviral-like aspartic protease family protein [Candidatus Aenigmarchaeota archaeon]